MKALLAALVLVGTAAHAAPVPTGHKMECWDHTFAYNRLNLTEASGKVTIALSGQSLGVFTQLTGVKGWGEVTVTATFPVEQCAISANDKKLISCTGDLKLDVKEQVAGGTIKRRTVPLKYAQLMVRKVSEVILNPSSPSTDDLQAYEATIVAQRMGDVVQFAQLYGTRMFPDQLDACELK